MGLPPPTISQLRVLDAYARLGSQKKVAHELDIELQTVKWHMQNLYARLGVGGAMEALSALGWVHGPFTRNKVPCGVIVYCGRPIGHAGEHGGYQPFLRSTEDEQES